jgi:hypothetical protein
MGTNAIADFSDTSAGPPEDTISCPREAMVETAIRPEWAFVSGTPSVLAQGWQVRWPAW